MWDEFKKMQNIIFKFLLDTIVKQWFNQPSTVAPISIRAQH